MRWLLVTIGLGVSAVWAAAQLPAPKSEDPHAGHAWSSHDWVRTEQGWERPADWPVPHAFTFRPTLHPLTVAAAELLLVMIVVTARRSEEGG